MQPTAANFIPVILGTAINAYGIARALHEEYGVISVAFGRARLRETANSKIIDVRVSPDYATEEGLVAALIEFAQNNSDKQLVLFPTIESYINTAIRHREELIKYFKLPLVDAELASRLVDKADFYNTCAQYGIPHPTTLTVTKDDVWHEDFGTELGFDYPAILKPSDTEIYPSLKFPGQKKIYLCATPEELRKESKNIYQGGYVGDLIVQENLAGGELVMQSANSYSTQNGKTAYVSIAQLVLAEHNPKLVGNTNAVVTVGNQQITDNIVKLLDTIGYVGPANFDLMLDPKTGLYKFLEINLRPGATSYYCTATGKNLAAMYVRDLVGNEEIALTVPTNKIFWRNVPTFVAMRLVPQELRALVKEGKKNRTAHSLWYSKDLNPKRFLQLLKYEYSTGKSALDNAKYKLNK